MIKAAKRLFSPRIISLFMVVVALGFVLWFDLWSGSETPPEVHAFRYRKLNGARSPASVPAIDAIPSTYLEPDRIATVNWECERPTKTVETLQNVRQIRLNGSCSSRIKKIINRNNGYTANIFQLKDNFTTDYMSLEVGTNRLEFEYADGATGKSPQFIEIGVEKQ